MNDGVAGVYESFFVYKNKKNNKEKEFSQTSKEFTGLTFVDLFALGIANGKSIFFNTDLMTLCFGNLIATVLNPAQARG